MSISDTKVEPAGAPINSDGKDCFRIIDQVRRIAEPSKQILAFAGRLSSELASGFCEGRVCVDCAVSQVRRGIHSIDLSGREMVVSVVSTALSDRLSSESPDA